MRSRLLYRELMSWKATAYSIVMCRRAGRDHAILKPLVLVMAFGVVSRIVIMYACVANIQEYGTNASCKELRRVWSMVLD